MSTTQLDYMPAAAVAPTAWSSLVRGHTVADVAEHAPADYLSRLGAVIVELRAMQHMSQATLAAAIEVSEPTLSRWETGKSQPRAYDLMRLARVLDAPAELLLDPPERAVSPVALRIAAMRAAERGIADAEALPTPVTDDDPGSGAGRDPVRGQRRTDRRAR